MDILNALERAVLEKLLTGSHPSLAVLRSQLEKTSVGERKMTGVGFFTSLMVAPDTPRAPVRQKSVRLIDVDAEIEGLSHGASFVLYIENGVLAIPGRLFVLTMWL